MDLRDHLPPLSLKVIGALKSPDAHPSLRLSAIMMGTFIFVGNKRCNQHVNSPLDINHKFFPEEYLMFCKSKDGKAGRSSCSWIPGYASSKGAARGLSCFLWDMPWRMYCDLPEARLYPSQRCPPGVCGIEGCCRSLTRTAVMGLWGVSWKVFYECGVEQRTERDALL